MARDFFVAVTSTFRLLYVFVVMEHGSRRLIHCFGLRVLKIPPRSPMANGICERLIGTIRRECLDWLIPLSEAHLRLVLKSWIGHYNRGRPHMVLGPGVPDPPAIVSRSMLRSRHILADFESVRGKAVLGGLHHEYSLAPA